MIPSLSTLVACRKECVLIILPVVSMLSSGFKKRRNIVLVLMALDITQRLNVAVARCCHIPLNVYARYLISR